MTSNAHSSTIPSLSHAWQASFSWNNQTTRRSTLYLRVGRLFSSHFLQKFVVHLGNDNLTFIETYIEIYMQVRMLLRI